LPGCRFDILDYVNWMLDSGLVRSGDFSVDGITNPRGRRASAPRRQRRATRYGRPAADTRTLLAEAGYRAARIDNPLAGTARQS